MKRPVSILHAEYFERIVIMSVYKKVPDLIPQVIESTGKKYTTKIWDEQEYMIKNELQEYPGGF